MQHGRVWALAFGVLSASCGSNPSIDVGNGGTSNGAGGSRAEAGRGNSSGTVGFDIGGTAGTGPGSGGGGAGPDDTTGCGDGKLQKASLGEV
jgi:hypothetical protein